MTIALNHEPAQIIARLLLDNDLVSDPEDYEEATQMPADAWPIYSNDEPDMPDNCITVYDSAAIVHGRSQPDGEILKHDGFQLRVRSADYLTGYRKANELLTWMSEECLRETVSMQEDDEDTATSYEVPALSRFQGINRLGDDDPRSKRQLFTINFCGVVRQL